MAGKDNASDSGKRRGGVPLLVVILVVLLAAGGAGAAAWFLSGRSSAHAATEAEGGEEAHAGAVAEKKKNAPAQYLALDPAFVVNMADEDAQHYLQTDVQVMARDAAALEAARTHMPRIRNNLLLLFSQQKTADVHDRAGRERLAAAALKEVQDVLAAETGKPGVEALYFTSFVTQ